MNVSRHVCKADPCQWLSKQNKKQNHTQEPVFFVCLSRTPINKEDCAKNVRNKTCGNPSPQCKSLWKKQVKRKQTKREASVSERVETHTERLREAAVSATYTSPICSAWHNLHLSITRCVCTVTCTSRRWGCPIYSGPRLRPADRTGPLGAASRLKDGASDSGLPVICHAVSWRSHPKL